MGTKPDRNLIKSLQQESNAVATIQERVNRKWDEQAIEKEAIALEKWIDNENNYYFCKFFEDRGYAPEQAERFSESNKIFCEALSRARRIQERRLVELAVSRKGDGNFIKFVLANKHNWKEKQEIAGDKSNPLSFVLDRIAQKPIEHIEIEPNEIGHE